MIASEVSFPLLFNVHTYFRALGILSLSLFLPLLVAKLLVQVGFISLTGGLKNIFVFDARAPLLDRPTCGRSPNHHGRSSLNNLDCFSLSFQPISYILRIIFTCHTIFIIIFSCSILVRLYHLNSSFFLVWVFGVRTRRSRRPSRGYWWGESINRIDIKCR